MQTFAGANERREGLWARFSSCIYIYTRTLKTQAALVNAKIGCLRRIVKERERTARHQAYSVCQSQIFRDAWLPPQKSRNFGRRFALEGRFVGHGRLSGVVSQTRLFSGEEFCGLGALAEKRGCKSKDSGEVEAAARFASQLVSAGTRRDKLSQSR